MFVVLALENKGFADFNPCDAGMQNCAPLHGFGPAVRNYYLVHFVLDGEGTFENSRCAYNVQKGQAFIIRPNELCTYTASKTNPWKYIWVGFTGRIAENFLSADDIIEFDENIVTEIKNVFSYNVGKEEYLAGILFKFYVSVFEKNIKMDYASKVKNYIDVNYMKNISICDLAYNLNLNRKYLSRKFKENTGISMQQYLVQKRLTEGKKLLKLGYNVEEVSNMVGYSDCFAFSKAFKKFFGNAPIKYKKITKKTNITSC